MSGPATFDVCGPLPEGTTVLEASAGTGKTFTIAALAARYVAEQGLPLESLLLVTFTRLATGELRARVRDRFVSAAAGLARAAAGVTPPDADEVLRQLCDAAGDERTRRHQRLVAALADFDAATIDTTHGFCQQILSGLGVAGDVEQDVTFIDDARDLVAEVVDDLYLRKYANTEQPPPFDRAEALALAELVVVNPLAPLEPVGAPQEYLGTVKRNLAVAVRNEVERRKRTLKILTYDDLLTRLAATLRDPVRGPAACARLRRRYRVVLVDEFQDTDPIQWEILQRAFATGGSDPDPSALVLIGDPKQAIYAFRGADVHAYLDAAAAADTQATLGINWRSDQGLVDALDALWHGTQLGHPGIGYRTVAAAPGHKRGRLIDAPAGAGAALRFRIAHRADGLVGATQKNHAEAAMALRHVADDLAGQAVALLMSAAAVVDRDASGAETEREPIRPGHLAVLVATHRQAAAVRAALSRAGVPSVLNGAGNVFGSDSARHWLVLLQALERPSSPVRAHAAALTPFFGWDAEAVATADDTRWEAVYARAHRWAAVLRQAGVAALHETVTRTENLPGRLLTRPDGERALTDLRHVAELLHREAVAAELGVTALTDWLRHRIGEAATETSDEERNRRLESDADAVQVLTIHRSKGLEFPVVYLPYLSEPSWIPDDAPPIYHDPVTGARTIDVGPQSRDWAVHRLRHVAEERGEDLRLAYVALTRARHQAVVWWTGTWNARNAPLTRLLFERDDDGAVGVESNGVPTDEQFVAAVEAVATTCPGTISVERTGPTPGRHFVAPGSGGDGASLTVNRFGRTLDRDWRRTSYSAITAAAHEAPVASEPDETRLDDEQIPADDPIDGVAPRPVAGTVVAEARLRAVRCPLGDMPGGTAVGTLVHAVFEELDFTSPDLDAELAGLLVALGSRFPVDLGPRNQVVTGLRAAIETPLGAPAGGLALRAIPRADRLDELNFELPLVGGDSPIGNLMVADIAATLRALLDPGDVLAGYAAHLEVPELATSLRGFLTGSIDAVLRTPGPDGTPRFTIVDYKTNWLGVDNEELSAWHYRPAALTDVMQRAHYPLQALLYAVALHRYLRWRLAGYDPARHLGGVLYLFVRGMTGAEGPTVDGQACGVFSWSPPAALVVALSDLFDRGAS